MEPEGSLPHSQVPATCPYLKPDQSSHIPTSHFLQIHLNIILPSTPGYPKYSLFLRFPHQNPVYTSPLPHTRYMPLPSHLILLQLIIRTVLGGQYRPLISSLYSFLHYPLRSKYSPQHPILKHPQPTFLPQCERPSFTPMQNDRQYFSSVHLNL